MAFENCAAECEITCPEDPADAVDAYGDGCEWYADYPGACGYYDTECFSAYDNCAAECDVTCPEDPADAVDAYGDGC